MSNTKNVVIDSANASNVAQAEWIELADRILRATPIAAAPLVALIVDAMRVPAGQSVMEHLVDTAKSRWPEEVGDYMAVAWGLADVLGCDPNLVTGVAVQLSNARGQGDGGVILSSSDFEGGSILDHATRRYADGIGQDPRRPNTNESELSVIDWLALVESSGGASSSTASGDLDGLLAYAPAGLSINDETGLHDRAISTYGYLRGYAAALEAQGGRAGLSVSAGVCGSLDGRDGCPVFRPADSSGQA